MVISYLSAGKGNVTGKGQTMSPSGSVSHESSPSPTMQPTSQPGVFHEVSTPQSFAAAQAQANAIKNAHATELAARGGVPVSAEERTDYAAQQAAKYGVGLVPQLKNGGDVTIVDQNGQKTTLDQQQVYEMQAAHFAGQTDVTNPIDYGTNAPVDVVMATKRNPAGPTTPQTSTPGQEISILKPSGETFNAQDVITGIEAGKNNQSPFNGKDYKVEQTSSLYETQPTSNNQNTFDMASARVLAPSSDNGILGVNNNLNVNSDINIKKSNDGTNGKSNILDVSNFVSPNVDNQAYSKKITKESALNWLSEGLVVAGEKAVNFVSSVGRGGAKILYSENSLTQEAGVNWLPSEKEAEVNKLADQNAIARNPAAYAKWREGVNQNNLLSDPDVQAATIMGAGIATAFIGGPVVANVIGAGFTAIGVAGTVFSIDQTIKNPTSENLGNTIFTGSMTALGTDATINGISGGRVPTVTGAAEGWLGRMFPERVVREVNPLSEELNVVDSGIEVEGGFKTGGVSPDLTNFKVSMPDESEVFIPREKPQWSATMKNEPLQYREVVANLGQIKSVARNTEVAVVEHANIIQTETGSSADLALYAKAQSKNSYLDFEFKEHRLIDSEYSGKGWARSQNLVEMENGATGSASQVEVQGFKFDEGKPRDAFLIDIQGKTLSERPVDFEGKQLINSNQRTSVVTLTRDQIVEQKFLIHDKTLMDEDVFESVSAAKNAGAKIHYPDEFDITSSRFSEEEGFNIRPEEWIDATNFRVESTRKFEADFLVRQGDVSLSGGRRIGTSPEGEMIMRESLAMNKKAFEESSPVQPETGIVFEEGSRKSNIVQPKGEGETGIVLKKVTKSGREIPESKLAFENAVREDVKAELLSRELDQPDTLSFETQQRSVPELGFVLRQASVLVGAKTLVGAQRGARTGQFGAQDLILQQARLVDVVQTTKQGQMQEVRQIARQENIIFPESPNQEFNFQFGVPSTPIPPMIIPNIPLLPTLSAGGAGMGFSLNNRKEIEALIERTPSVDAIVLGRRARGKRSPITSGIEMRGI